MNALLDDRQCELVRRVEAVAAAEAPGGFRPHTGSLPRDVLGRVAAAGLAGLSIPADRGGQGGTQLDAVLAIEAMAQHTAAGADALQALNFGAIQQLAHNGSPEQLERLLAPCLRGELLAAPAMSEPDAGSAVTDLATTAELSGDHVRINGCKRFITHGAVADLFVVWARFGAGARSAGAVVVPRDAPGLSIDASHRFMSGEQYGLLSLDDCTVPAANVLIAGEGFSRMLSVFNVERLGNASRSLGYGQAAHMIAIEHLRTRRQFGRRLVEFQGLQWRIAEMELKLASARMLLYRAAAGADAGLPSALDTALAKLACNRAGYEVADDAMQLLGAPGYDDDSTVSFILRRTRGWMIAGGSTEQLLNRIAAEVLGERFSQRPPPPATNITTS